MLTIAEVRRRIFDRCEKGKLVVRRGHKARGLSKRREVARLPNGARC